MKIQTNIIDQIKKRLEKLSPNYLDVLDESKKHLNHLGNKNNAGHYCITISSKIFINKNLLEQHKIIYDVLIDLFPLYIHAISIKII